VVADAVVVEVVEHGQAEFVALTVVGLGSVGASSVGEESPGVVDRGDGARGPLDGLLVVDHVAAGPKVFLVGVEDLVHEMARLVAVVEGNGSHTLRSAVLVGALGCEASAAQLPSQDVVTAAPAVVGAGVTAATSTTAIVVTAVATVAIAAVASISVSSAKDVS